MKEFYGIMLIFPGKISGSFYLEPLTFFGGKGWNMFVFNGKFEGGTSLFLDGIAFLFGLGNSS